MESVNLSLALAPRGWGSARLIPVSSPPMETPDPITVVTTGGTIDKLYFDSLSEYKVGESVVRKLLAIGNVKYPFDIVEALRKDSLELTDEDRDDLLQCSHIQDMGARASMSGMEAQSCGRSGRASARSTAGRQLLCHLQSL